MRWRISEGQGESRASKSVRDFKVRNSFVMVEQPSLEDWALFRDRFVHGDVSAWTFVNDGTSSGPSNWTTFQGGLRQTNDIFTPPLDRHTVSKQGTHAVAGDSAWTDVIITLQLHPTSQIFSEAGNSAREDVTLDIPWNAL
jgi:hypothetical protein